MSEGVDRMLESDKRFFENRPWRWFLLRRASRAEVETFELLNGGPFDLSQGGRIFCVIKNIGVNARMRLAAILPADTDTDVGDEIASGVFQSISTPETRRKESGIHRAARELGLEY
jgi:hypothetical protein